jgi:uncharacterized protein
MMDFFPKNAPIWQVFTVVNGLEHDITAKLSERLISLRISDKSGFESDEITIELSDEDGKLAIPNTGVVLDVRLGFDGQELRKMGLYHVDELEYSGEPNRLMLHARAAALSGKITEKKERSFHGKKLSDIVQKIAGEHKLLTRISGNFLNITIGHVDQTNESDINFLTRLGIEYDAMVAVKDKHLLFIAKGRGKTASDKLMPVVELERKDIESFRYKIADRDSYTGVRAYWQSVKKARRTGILVGKAEREKVLRKTYGSEAAAKTAAKAEWQRIQRGSATLSLTLSKANLLISPECKVIAYDLKPEITDKRWLVIETQVELSSSGLMMTIELEETTPDL